MRERPVSFRIPVWGQDVLLAVAITVMQVQGTLVKVDAEPASVVRPLADSGNLGYLLLILSGLSLAFRHRWPVPVFLICAAASVFYYALDFPDAPGWVALFVALYTVTAVGDGRRSVALAGAGIAVLAVGWLVSAADIEPRAAIGWVFFRIGASVMSAALGESVRSRRVIAADALERAERAERTREDEARARADEERLRIAREVHDTVAHAIAVINVQAGVTAHVLEKRPEQVRKALQTIEQTSSRALQEMRTILGVLRDEHEGRVPTPDIEQIDELIEKARGAGLDVHLERTSAGADVPSAVAGAVYRIVQESITNVLRHVGPTRVLVAVDCTGERLEVSVTDEGGGGAGEHGGGVAGRGILGMRERCHLLGGEFEARPVPGGGFRVRASLPVAPAGALL
jgi:signal transduction histidine kinase